jgi:hypothetical protein
MGALCGEDRWANGDDIISFVKDEANGATMTTCNPTYTFAPGIGIEYLAIDTNGVSSPNCAKPQWTPKSFFTKLSSRGADLEAYPAAAHLLSGSLDYIVMTYTHSTTSLEPTMNADVYIGNGNPSTDVPAQFVGTVQVETGGSGSATASRWGDFAGAWPSSNESYFDLSDDLWIDNSHNGYIAEVVP